MNVIILSAGSSAASAGDNYPICLYEFNSKPFIQILLEKWQGIDAKFAVMLNEEDIVKYHLDHVISQINSKAILYPISSPTAGAACTALMAIEQINNDEPLVILNGDELLDINYLEPLQSFRDQEVDAGTIIFDSVHPRYSYVRLDERDRVIEAAEKNPISRNATVGFYWYKHGSDFVRAAMRTIEKQALADTPFFVCPMFNELVLEGKQIGVYRIDKEAYKPFKSQQQLAQFQSVLEKLL
jgi:dTDP-glucose pyrophosphorylase